MTGKKNKKKAPEATHILQARHKRDYIARLKLVCDQLVGSGWFEKIPQVDVDIIYEKRYPPLSIKLAPGQNVNNERWINYQQGFTQMIGNPMHTVNGGQIPLRTMLTEGLCLLHFIDMMAENRFPGSESLKEVFKPLLLTTQQHYYEVADELSFILFLLDIRNGNYHDGFLLADTTQTNIGKVRTTLNTVFVHLHKPTKTTIVINDRKREIIQVSRPAPFGKTMQVMIRPSEIGLQAGEDKPLPLYIQQHALNRLDERLGLQPDVVHGHMFFTLFNQPVTYYKENGHSLISFNIHERKVGYLLTTLHEDKLLVRSFLFLTNDGTPEGRMLRQLTGLQKYDKKYLGIDKLSTFNAYHIDQNEELSALFREAGCGSLLETGYLEIISTAYTPNRDANQLSRYLA